MSGDSAKKREGPPRLEWQSELDATMQDIDLRLTHPRRRATDPSPQPALPGLGEVDLTSELLDEIAWRVVEQIRRQKAAFPPEFADQAAKAPSAPAVKDSGKRARAALTIRYRMPLLPWPFRLLQRRRRKKQHPLTTMKASA